MKARRVSAEVAVLVVVLLLAMAAPAFAADSVTVNAEVDVNPYSIVLDDGATLDYGTLDVGGWGFAGLMEQIVVRNNGGASVKLDMIGTDAGNGSGGVWELDADSGADQFRWILNGYGVNDDSATTLRNSLDPGESSMFDAVVAMPTSTTQYGTYTWSGTIYASAP